MKMTISIISFLLSFPALLMLDTEKTPFWMDIIIIAWFAASALAVGHYRKKLIRGNQVVE